MRKTSFHPGLLFSFQGPRRHLEPVCRLRETGSLKRIAWKASETIRQGPIAQLV